MSRLASLKCTDYGLQRRTLVITSVFLALRKRLRLAYYDKLSLGLTRVPLY